MIKSGFGGKYVYLYLGNAVTEESVFSCGYQDIQDKYATLQNIVDIGRNTHRSQCGNQPKEVSSVSIVQMWPREKELKISDHFPWLVIAFIWTESVRKMYKLWFGCSSRLYIWSIFLTLVGCSYLLYIWRIFAKSQVAFAFLVILLSVWEMWGFWEVRQTKQISSRKLNYFHLLFNRFRRGWQKQKTPLGFNWEWILWFHQLQNF